MDRFNKYGTFFGNDREPETAYRVIEVCTNATLLFLSSFQVGA